VLLQLTAVAGAPLSSSALRRAAQLGSNEYLTALDELRAAGLLVVHDGAEAPHVAIYHTQIRDGVCAQLEQTKLCELHHALARALAEEPTRDCEALAVHWERASCMREAASCYVQAAREADRARAFAHAAALYERALGCAVGEQTPREWMLLHAAALANAGRSREAAEAYVKAADRPEPAQARDALRAAARHFLSAGDSARALAIADQLLSEVDVHISRSTPGAIASAVWQRARLRVQLRDVRERVGVDEPKKAFACDVLFEIANPLGLLDLTRSWDLHTRSLRLALELGDTKRMARALAGEAIFAGAGSSAEELRALGMMAHAEHLAQRTQEPKLIAWVKLCSAWRQIMAGEPQLALTEADAALQLFQEQCDDVAWELGSAHAVSLSALTALGSFDELKRRYRAAVDVAQQRGDIPSFVTLVATNGCVVDLVADRPEQCRALLADVTRAWPAEREVQHTWALGGQAVIDLYLGGAAAHHRIEREWPRLRRQLTLYNGRINAVLTLVRGTAALAADGCNPAARVRIVRSCIARLLAGRPRDVRASGHFLRAQLATWQGMPEEALVDYAHAAELWEGVGIYLGYVARQRQGELMGGDAGAAWIAQAQAWARSRRIVKVDRFFAACGPITGAMLGAHKR
jgi:eukaryotic-like serine/threonine-protein kinase